MVKGNNLCMSADGSSSSVKNFVSFDGKNLLAGVGLLALVLMVGGVVAQAQSVPDVSVNSNGVTINTGSLDVNGNDIEDAGTTIFDAANGNIATGVVDYTAATASDVGLGNVENIALSTIGGNDISWDGTNNVLNVDSSTIQSGTTASDVGLGNVRNVDLSNTVGTGLSYNSNTDRYNVQDSWIDENGDTINGNLDIGTEDTYIGSNNNNNILFNPSGTNYDVYDVLIQATSASGEVAMVSADGPLFVADSDADSGGPYECRIQDNSGDFTCDGAKSWVHDLGNGSEAFYTSQESPMVRAVYEGQTTVENGANTLNLPSHFEKTVSDTNPMLRVQATPHELANVAVTSRSDSQITIEASKDVTVDYRVTGIREGYEDKQVVRPKEE